MTEDFCQTSIPWVAVVAMAENRVIGREGKLPWHLPGDLRFFKQLTSGGTILMGRKTYESIGRPLPNRRNLVLSRAGVDAEGIESFASLEEVAQALGKEEKLFVIGGEEVYRLTKGCWSEVYLTKVRGSFEGDAVFPPFETDFPVVERVLESDEFVVDHYRRSE